MDEEQIRETDAQIMPTDIHNSTNEREQQPDGPVFFLSYNKDDSEFVKKLYADLAERDIKAWMAPQDMPPGASWEEIVRATISSASAVIYIASPNAYNSPIVRGELSFASQYKRTIYPLLIQGDWKDVAPLRLDDLHYIDARENYQNALQDLVKILRQPPRLTKVLPITEAIDALPSPLARKSHKESKTARRKAPRITKDLTAPMPETFDALPSQQPRNPYKGLRPFQQEDANDFFGRDTLIQELVTAIKTRLTPPLPRILTISGPSGSGKSSLVMAGLLPALEREQRESPESPKWTYLKLEMPNQDPIEELAHVLYEHFRERSIKSLKDDLYLDTARGLHRLLTTLKKQTETRVLLFIDQFEKIFAPDIPENERHHFLTLLLTACTEPDGPCMLLLTLRADFHDQLSRYREFATLVNKNHIDMPLMKRHDFRDVIKNPARAPKVQLTFEEGFVEDLLFEICGQPGSLPWLEFILFQLSEKPVEKQLTRQAYQNIGSIGGALAQHAELIYTNLPSDNHRDLARALFLRLINQDSTGQDTTCRRIPLSDLVLVEPEQTARLKEVINIFVEQHILVANSDADTPIIEFAHKALVQAWPRLNDWVKEFDKDIRQQKTINEAAVEWQSRNQSVVYLYREEQLANAIAWSKRFIPNLIEAAFLEAAENHWQATLVKQERKRVEEDQESQNQREYTRRTIIIGLLGGVALVGETSILGYEHLFNTSQAKRPSQQKALPNPYFYTGHQSVVRSVAWSPDSKRLASAGDDGTVQVWDASTGDRLLTHHDHNEAVWSVVWSPDGKRLASAGDDQTVYVWDASTEVTDAHLLTYRGHSFLVQSLAWSPNGKYLASASQDKTVQVWDASTGAHQLIYHNHDIFVQSVAWSPDGKWLASAGGDGTVHVWNASIGAHLLTYRGHSSLVQSLAWSFDSKWLASASDDKTVQIWHASTGNLLYTYYGHNGRVLSVAWFPSRESLASTSDDKTVQEWRVQL